MLKSMTAYGHAEKRSILGSVTVEIQSLNRKFLDLGVSLPKELFSFDVSVRNRVSSTLKRGKVNIKIAVEYAEGTPVSVKPNLPLTRQIKDAWELIEKELHIDCKIDLKVISQMPDVIQYAIKRDSEAEWEELVLDAVDEALEKAMQMRKQEGKVISTDFSKRLELLELHMKEVEILSPRVKERNRNKLRQILSEFLDDGEGLEERLLKEACIFAEKVDIEEEITRFFSHIGQFKKKMEASDDPIGKTLEFLLQEMQREVNTVGSKAQDLDISRLVVEMKTEIERIREQVQNVE